MPASMPASMTASPDATTDAPSPSSSEAPPPAPLAVEPPGLAPPLTAGSATSRPGATESARLLLRGAGLLSIGIGAQASLGPAQFVAGERLVAPDLTLRYAILDGVEIRVSTTGEIRPPRDRMSIGSSGFTGFSLGSSVSVLRSNNWYLPDLALLMTLGIPIATLFVDDVAVEARAMAAWRLLDRVTLAGNLGAGFDGVANTFLFPYTAQIAVDVGGGLGAFGETFGSISLNGQPDVWVDGGIYYDVGTLVRVDMSAGLQPFGNFSSVTAGGWFVGVGASVLLPGHLAMFGGAH